jgi:chorismate synthase
MSGLSYRTAGESHGRSLVALVEGMPAGVTVDHELINAELLRRQGGYGRGGRMKIERDRVDVLSGVRGGVTIGSPIALQIINRDVRIDDAPSVHRPRPGHADLAGSLKWLTTDCRATLERASARETAARVAAGALSRLLLLEFGIEVLGYVVQMLEVRATFDRDAPLKVVREQRDANEAYCPDAAAAQRMIDAIRQAKKDKDTVGGIVEVQVRGHPPGLGSCARWQDKLDGRLMQALGSVQAFKGVEIGLGFETAARPGSQVHDEIDFDPAQVDTPSLGFTRRTNNAGGLEGGMTNGAPIIVRGVMKPISTLLRGMDSVNLETKAPERSDYERSDVSAVPAASVVAENVVAFEIARVFLEKFAGDTLGEVRAAYDHFLSAARRLGDPRGSADRASGAPVFPAALPGEPAEEDGSPEE